VLAEAFYHHPSREMQVVGITGTNGKTTTAYLVASIFDAANLRSGLLGTVGYRIGSVLRDATRTTPEAPELQAMLREMVDAGCRACAMEVSSHALSLRRVDAMTFAAGVFTNLTRDHLDFHADMEEYFQAKRRLFEMLPRDAPSLINIDDPRGPSLTEVGGRPVTYAINRPADITAGPLSFSLDGLSFDVRTPRGTIRVKSRLVGRPNVYNILAAVATATALDLSFDAIERGVSALDGVPGRFQVVSGARDEVTVVVDYAHTDDALRNLLETARPLARGRVITVFGCGGDRDRGKRPLMGGIAARLADRIWVTSDNPRSERPEAIIEEIQRSHRRHPPRQRSADARDRRPPRGNRRGDRAGAAGGSGAGGREGAREVPGDRQPGAAVRRCRGGARSARSQADELRCCLRPMLYHLLSYLQGQLTALNLGALVNVTRYITVRTAVASLSALAISLLLGPWMIPSCASSRSARGSGRRAQRRTARKAGPRRWAAC
jgi:UDP-N-acetylmuramoyl-L-alanyl-D-glutamate--2,6-diaminopimelate ligase